MQAKLLAQNEQTRELLKAVIKGGVDGKITPELCKRLGMSEAEIRDLLQKIKTSEESDTVSYKKLESAVRTWYSVKTQDENERLKQEVQSLKQSFRQTGALNIHVQDSENNWADQAAKVDKAPVDELRKMIKDFAEQLQEKQAMLNQVEEDKNQMQEDFK